MDPIENEEDRKKVQTNKLDHDLIEKLNDALSRPLCFQAVASINSSLERADRVYRQLSSHRTPLDLLLTRILEHGDAEVSKVRQPYPYKFGLPPLHPC